MYCRECGSQIQDGEQFCNKCGTPVREKSEKDNREPALSVIPSADEKKRQSNGRAIASLVIGIFGVLVALFFSSKFFAIVLGIIGIILYSNSKKIYGPSGLATTGLILGIIAIVIGAVWFLFF